MEDKKNSLQKNIEPLKGLIEISHNKDLLSARPISMVLKMTEERVVYVHVSMCIDKACDVMGIQCDPARQYLLAIELVETYPNESIEDIQEMLKKGRRGQLDSGFEKRGIINFSLLSSWMDQHLTDKYKEKERQAEEEKNQGKEPLEEVDYESYKKRTSGPEPEKLVDRQYNELKTRHFQSKKI